MNEMMISKMKLIDTLIDNKVSIVLDNLSVLTQIIASMADIMAELIPTYMQMFIIYVLSIYFKWILQDLNL